MVISITFRLQNGGQGSKFPGTIPHTAASIKSEEPKAIIKVGCLPDEVSAMRLDCIKVWKFDEAPAELKVGYRGKGRPQWLAFVPRSINGADLGPPLVYDLRPFL